MLSVPERYEMRCSEALSVNSIKCLERKEINTDRGREVMTTVKGQIGGLQSIDLKKILQSNISNLYGRVQRE